MRMRPKPASRRGFTLLEVMIVVGIAALILAISVPFVQRTFKRDAVYRAVKVVEDALHNARATAIFNNAPTDLIIHPQNRSFQVAASGPRSPSATLDDPQDRDEVDDRDRMRGGARASIRDFSRHAPKPFSGTLEDEVSIELLDVNFQEYRDEEEARVRFHPNGTSDEFTIVMKIGSTAWRKITLDLVTGLPTLETMR